MTTALAISGWLGFGIVVCLMVARNRVSDAATNMLSETVQRLYEDNCALRNVVADKDAELNRIGVTRNAKGQLESIR